MHTSNHTCKSRVISLFIFLFATVSCSSAFIVTTRTTSRRTSTSTIKSTVPIPGSTILHMAGFGGGSSNSKNKKKNKKNTPQKKTSTLKPKQQWDRYAKNLKAATAFKVGVRVVNDDSTDNDTDTDTENENKWLETGKVKSDNNESTEIAVAMQRGIIAEHSKRLYPLKVLPKDKVEWAFSTSLTPEQADWTLINVKDVAQNAPSGIEKVIGFEGKPDPASGFYCHYEGGRLVDRYSGEGSVD